MPPPKIVHVALADARGHLMRAHLLRELLARIDVEVDIVTTQEAGRAFLASMGTPSVVLPGRFRMELDERHELKLGRTRRRFVRYAVADMRNDVDALRALTSDAMLVVNDSFHPVLLAAHRTLPGARVVHLHGANLKRTVTSTSRPFRVERWLSRGFAEIVHTLDPIDTLDIQRVRTRRGERSVVSLPPLVALPRRSPAEVRALAIQTGGTGLLPVVARRDGRDARPTCRAGAIGEARIAAVYLNPHYSDPSIAELVEAACDARGLALYGVSEAFAGRPGWIASDASFVDVVAAADVFISGAGMGALEQARVTGTPLVCLLGRQEEQTKNVVDRSLPHVHVRDPNALSDLVNALSALPEKRDTHAIEEIARVHAMWTETFVTLLKGAHDGEHRKEQRARDRDQQPAWWQGPRRPLARSSARASAREPAAVVAR